MGWWSLYIDGVLARKDFRYDPALKSFDGVAINVSRDQSEIEWVRMSVECPVPAPGGVVLSIVGVGLVNCLRRRAWL